MKLGRFDLKKLRGRDIAIICLVVTVLALAGWYFYLYNPTLQRADDLEARIESLTVQVARGEAARDNLPQLREDIARLELERQQFLAQLPREGEVAALLDQLRGSATDTGVILESLGQGNGSGSEGIEEVRPMGFTMSTSGTFAQTMSFLEELETLQRFTKVRQMGISVPSNDGGLDPQLKANYNFTVYVFTGNDPGEE